MTDTSSTATPPAANTGGPKDVRKMTPAEVGEFERKHGLRPLPQGRPTPPRPDLPYWQAKPTR